MVKKIITIICVIMIMQNTVFAKDKNDTMFQVSTIDALLNTFYDNDYTFKELKKHGKIGIGTVNQVDGEMIALDGIFYQIKADGKVYIIVDSMKTPFAEVTDFFPDKSVEINEPMDMKQLQDYLDINIPTKNIFYAFKITGKFKNVTTRSIPIQSKPYIPLTEVVKNQVIFDLKDVEGTIIGFRSPESAKGLNVAGYHFHFLSKDKKTGGHVLDCQIEKVKADIDFLSKLKLALPTNQEFYQLDLSGQKQSDIEQVEKLAPKID